MKLDLVTQSEASVRVKEASMAPKKQRVVTSECTLMSGPHSREETWKLYANIKLSSAWQSLNGPEFYSRSCSPIV